MAVAGAQYRDHRRWPAVDHVIAILLPVLGARSAGDTVRLVTPEDVVHSHYAGIAARDLTAALAPLHRDVEWVFSGPQSIPFAGTFHGIEGVRRFFDQIRGAVVVEEFSITEMIREGNRVVVLGHETMTVKSTGRHWSSEWAQVHEVVENRIRRFREFADTHAIAAAFT